jgi:hypothetical protein
MIGLIWDFVGFEQGCIASTGLTGLKRLWKVFRGGDFVREKNGAFRRDRFVPCRPAGA